jgi:RNA-directed DNA polymerase
MNKMSNMSRSQWQKINWKNAFKTVHKLQLQIASAYKLKDFSRVRMLQDQLVRSYAARALAVRKVTSNRGNKTPGLDNVIWDTPQKRAEAIKALGDITPKNYKPMPVKRVYVPKPNGEKRPLGIPCMLDRAYQTLWDYALIPIAETTGDIRSYGFRPYRSTMDAASYVALLLKNPKASRTYVLEGDIAKFFDSVDHKWLLENIPMNLTVLRKLLSAGVSENGTITRPTKGFIQGGPLSPTLANYTLNGLENIVTEKFRVCRYADDFVVLGPTGKSLADIATPLIQKFLEERGLSLNTAKTRITDARVGFNFLGYTFRLYPKLIGEGTTFHLRPQPEKVMAFKKELKQVILQYTKPKVDAKMLILKLNPMLRGWANYYRSTQSTDIFKMIGKYLWTTIWSRIVATSRGAAVRPLAKKFYKTVGAKKWIFFYADPLTGQEYTLYQIADTLSLTHILLKGGANPFDPEFDDYLLKRSVRGAKLNLLLTPTKKILAGKQNAICPVCETDLINSREPLEIHHIKPITAGGGDELKNLVLLHKNCHSLVTYTKDRKLIAALKEKGVIL